MYMNSLGFPEMPRGGGGAALLPILQMKLLSLARASYVYLLVVPPIDGEDLALIGRFHYCSSDRRKAGGAVQEKNEMPPWCPSTGMSHRTQQIM